MAILFITSTRIGDAVLSTGLLAAIRRGFPPERLHVACGPVAAIRNAPPSSPPKNDAHTPSHSARPGWPSFALG